MVLSIFAAFYNAQANLAISAVAIMMYLVDSEAARYTHFRIAVGLMGLSLVFDFFFLCFLHSYFDDGVTSGVESFSLFFSRLSFVFRVSYLTYFNLNL